METLMSEQMMKIMRMTLSASWRMNWKWRSTWSRSCRMRRTRWEENTNCPCFSISEKGWWSSGAQCHLTSPWLWGVISSGLPEQPHSKNRCHPCTDTLPCIQPLCISKNNTLPEAHSSSPWGYQGTRWDRTASELVLCPCLQSHLDLIPHYHSCWLVSRCPAIFFFLFFSPRGKTFIRVSPMWTFSSNVQCWSLWRQSVLQACVVMKIGCSFGLLFCKAARIC